MRPMNVLRAALRLCRQQARTKAGRQLTLNSMNQNIVKVEYAVRGPLVIRSVEIAKELRAGAKKPFRRVINANIGDAHAMGQKPITFIRNVLACVSYPDLIKRKTFKEDVNKRATQLLRECGGSMGAYTGSQGVEMIRRHVAAYIERRDNHPAEWKDVSLSAGASAAIKSVLQLLSAEVNGKPPGVMVPIPQYPLYSASLSEYGLQLVGYYLDEDNGWGLDAVELQRSLEEASRTINVRAIVVINPGNPTGQVLKRKHIEEVIKFSHDKGLFIFADEVYQDNVYEKDSKFHSFKKVLRELGGDISTQQELVSFMSVSKGYMGECGLRSGWMELVNMDPVVQQNLYKVITATLCPSSIGQCVTDCVARPPTPGEPSYDRWLKEKTNVLNTLKKRAKIIAKTFNSMEGFKCNALQGAMYAFPRIELPPKAIEAAKRASQPPDVFYAFRLLEETGICVVPGSGFGQRPNTYHFRTTILPQTPLLKEMLDIFQKFQIKFTKEFS